MEALVAASCAALTVYDMCKALDKGIEISDVYLLRKTGGKSGDFVRAQQEQCEEGEASAYAASVGCASGWMTIRWFASCGERIGAPVK
jgi:hypothetical protein